MRRGFTLIEVMLAVTILAIIAVLIYGAFEQTARNKRLIDKDLDHYRTVQLTLERMVRELTMAYASTHVNPSPSLQVVRTGFIGEDHGREDRIDFTSFSHRRLFRNAQESDQNELSYFMTRHPDQPGVQVLARREQNRVDEDFQRGGTAQILIEDIESFEVDYFDPISSEWVKTWDSTQPLAQPNRLPEQVRIFVTVPDSRRPGKSQTFGTRATLPMTYALNHSNFNP